MSKHLYSEVAKGSSNDELEKRTPESGYLVNWLEEYQVEEEQVALEKAFGFSKDVPKNSAEEESCSWPSDENLEEICAPLIKFVEGNEMSSFSRQLNDSFNESVIDEEPQYPILDFNLPNVSESDFAPQVTNNGPYPKTVPRDIETSFGLRSEGGDENEGAIIQVSEASSTIVESEGSKPKRRNREVSLWKFLYRLLAAPADHQNSKNNNLIRWVDPANYVFRVVDTFGLAYRWGKEKKKENMNYDKMSRALRQYKHGEVQKLPGTKLTFKFGEVVVREIQNGNI